MDRNKLKQLWDLCGSYLLMILCGAILLLFPNSATALVTKLLAWLMLAVGVYHVVQNLRGHSRDVNSWFWVVLELAVGCYILSHPLAIANLIGRALGIFLIFQGLQDLRRGTSGLNRLPGILTLAAGVVLLLMPRTLVNTLLGLVGLVLIAIGALNTFSILRAPRQLEEASDPNIIDADE